MFLVNVNRLLRWQVRSSNLMFELQKHGVIVRFANHNAEYSQNRSFNEVMKSFDDSRKIIEDLIKTNTQQGLDNLQSVIEEYFRKYPL